MSECSGADCQHQACVAKRQAAQFKASDLTTVPEGMTREKWKRQRFLAAYGASAKTIEERTKKEQESGFKMHNSVAEAAVVLAGKALVPTPAMLPPPPPGVPVGRYLLGADGHVYVVRKETTAEEQGTIELAPQEKQVRRPQAARKSRPRKEKTNGHKLTPPGTQPKHKPWSIVKEPKCKRCRQNGRQCSSHCEHDVFDGDCSDPSCNNE